MLKIFEKLLARVTTWVWRYERFMRRVRRENRLNYGRLLRKRKGGK